MFSSLLTLLIYTLWRVTLSFLAPIITQTFAPSDSMDIKGCRNSGKRAIHLGRCHHEIEHVHSLPPKLRWKLLWMKIKKEKKRLFRSASFQVPYDQHTYSQNFDQGTAIDEPDNLSRSFSVRFADPSIVFVTRK
ncbi:hypothetical protein DEO72_LG2g5650 [Vigna unguiculata]|uniref:Uncharacterized protein n=1 Tax=Vigna unguiculata TaxID=3917 RepID=A0A4D6LA15_VIGUN|nr:hypothetical protein DEO72_LG2g5650 [Vigna unguiculata]